MKGQAAVVIIILVVVGVAIYFFWPQISQLFPPSGNGGVVTPEYKNDIMEIQDIYISNLKPYAGTKVQIKFWIKNNGDREVEKVKVNFYNLPGFENPEISCELPSEPSTTHSCVLENMGSLDQREVSLTLDASKEIMAKPEAFKISYSIEYNYPGYRIANIPFIDGVTRTHPMNKFSESGANYGPIVLNFELQVRKEINVGEQVIKEHWAEPNLPFEVTFNFKDVVGKASPKVNILNESIRLNVSQFLTKTEPCDFKIKNDILISTKDVLVPGKLICFFINSSAIDQPETLVSIKAEFNYTYKFGGSKTFTIQPLPE